MGRSTATTSTGSLLLAHLINEKEARLYHAKLQAEIPAKSLVPPERRSP
jgi:hypothetical protein